MKGNTCKQSCAGCDELAKLECKFEETLNNSINSIVEKLSVKKLVVNVEKNNLNHSPTFDCTPGLYGGSYNKIISDKSVDKNRLYAIEGFAKIPGITRDNKIINMFIRSAGSSYGSLRNCYLTLFEQYENREQYKDITYLKFWGLSRSYSGSNDIIIDSVNLIVYYI